MIERISQFIQNQGISVRSFEQSISASKAVWEALVYRSNSSKARLIRKVALERGGVEIGDQKEAV